MIVVFPDAAVIAIGAIRATFTARNVAASVGARVPDSRDSTTRFVRVQRIGGPRQTPVSDAALLSVDSWGVDESDAHDLAQLARGSINEMQNTVVGGVQVYFVNELSGPALLPDPTSNQPRYTQNIQVSMRGTAA